MMLSQCSAVAIALHQFLHFQSASDVWSDDPNKHNNTIRAPSRMLKHWRPRPMCFKIENTINNWAEKSLKSKRDKINANNVQIFNAIANAKHLIYKIRLFTCFIKSSCACSCARPPPGSKNLWKHIMKLGALWLCFHKILFSFHQHF